MLHEHLTPSGFEIAFEDGDPHPVTGKSKRRAYTVDGQKLVSVTTALGVIEKPGLSWAAEKLTVEGCIALAQEGALPEYVPAALSALGARELRFRQRWDAKAASGNLAHDDLLALATGSDLSDLSKLSSDEKGIVQAVSAWYADYRPEAEHSELMVASKAHGFAGRLDLIATTHRIPGRGLWDLKTTSELPTWKSGEVKPPYDEQLWQVEAYNLAAVESGYGDTDYRAVLRVDSTGTYDVCVSWVNESGFLAALNLYREKRAVSSERPKDWHEAAAA